METPKLVDIEQQTDGWVKKYVLKYEMPDGTMHDYHCATRRSVDEFRAGLERNARVSRAVMDGLQAPDEPFTPDAVCIVAKTPRDTLVKERISLQAQPASFEKKLAIRSYRDRPCAHCLNQAIHQLD